MPFHKWLQCAFFTTLFLLLVLVGASAAHAGAVEDCNQVRDPNRRYADARHTSTHVPTNQ